MSESACGNFPSLARFFFLKATIEGEYKNLKTKLKETRTVIVGAYLIQKKKY